MERKKTASERIILTINSRTNYGLRLSHETKIIYSHTSKIIKKLIEEGILVKSEKNGRKKELRLTERGERVKEAYIKLNEAYNFVI